MSNSDPQKPKRTVRATRRRPSQSDGAERERAAAPNRERPQQPNLQSQGGAGLPPRPAQPYTQGGAAGGGMRNLLLIGVVLLLMIVGGPAVFSGLGDTSTEPQQPVQQPEQPVQQASSRPTASARPQPSARPAQSVAPAAGGTGGERWLVMMYLDADDRVLEQDIFVDLNEAERVGSSEQVQIVAQMDRYQGGFAQDGDWTSTKRFYVTQDDDLGHIASQEVADLGEANMADSATLVDFATWAIENYPADKHVLLMSDHGIGWPGGWSDPTAQTRGPSDLPLASSLGDQLYLMEIDQALEQIRANTGLDKLEMIGMDACLMGHIEVFTALAPHARYMVASQEVEPSLGWAYASFLGALQQNPGMGGGELGRLIVDSYIEQDQRIVDDQARADFVGRGAGSLLGSLFGPAEAPSAAQLTQQLERNVTLSAIDLQNAATLNDALNGLAFALQSADQRAIAQARSYSQSYTSVFGESVPPSYIDIGNFAQLVAQAGGDGNVQNAAQAVLDALGSVVLAEKHGANKPGSSGASIYFPNSQLYGNATAGPPSYTVAARRFAEQSLWDDFLAFHYTGRQFDQAAAEVAVPDRAQAIAPPAGAIQVSPLSVSSPSVAIGNTILLSADITGDNVGYIKLLVGFLDQDANSLRILDGDFLDSNDTREVDGVPYPDWGTGEFRLEFEWEPIVTAIEDGQTTVVAYLQPESYGAAPEEAVYTVDGIYTFADGGEQRSARLYFSGGRLRQVLSFTNNSSTGAPWEIAPRSGDTFQIGEQWLDLDANGQTTQTSVQLGDTLTFGDDVFTLAELDAPAGEYVVGCIVEDLDGRPTAAYGRVRVE